MKIKISKIKIREFFSISEVKVTLFIASSALLTALSTFIQDGDFDKFLSASDMVLRAGLINIIGVFITKLNSRRKLYTKLGEE